MKDLISLWERRAEKFNRLGRKSDGLNQEGLFAMSDAYSVCASELQRKIAEGVSDEKY